MSPTGQALVDLPGAHFLDFTQILDRTVVVPASSSVRGYDAFPGQH